MADFSYLKNPLSKRWVIAAPRRAKRPELQHGEAQTCPFCPGKEATDGELYRVGGEGLDSNWEVRVIPNRYPFAPVHELVIETREHNVAFDSFPREHIERIVQTYRHRFNEHHHLGQVVIFHNHGEKAGESIPHSHTQISVIPEKVYLEVPRLQSVLEDIGTGLATEHFTVFCPRTSTWPDEVWIAPKKSGRLFGESTDDELSDFSGVLKSLLTIYRLRYHQDFPYNFYFYPGNDWYFRLIPRVKTHGGFEVATNVFVNTQRPEETMAFIQEHFHHPNVEKILAEHQAEYHLGS